MDDAGVPQRSARARLMTTPCPTGRCECCWTIRRPGNLKEPMTWPVVSTARYAWTIRSSGRQVRLCVRCCALWRQNAAEDPDLEPARIAELSA